MDYTYLLQLLEQEEIELVEHKFSSNDIKGLYVDNIITINSKIDTQAEKKCILAEELGHHYTTSGDIINQGSVTSRKKEALARRWSYERLVPLTGFVYAWKAGVRNRFELAEFFEVTEDCLDQALKFYQEKYGLYYHIENFIIHFDPLYIMEYFWKDPTTND